MQPALLECPTCGTPSSKTDLGLRDYSRWLNPILPGKVGGSDIDLVLHQETSGRILMLEFKEANKRLSIGQRMLLRGMVSKGIDVWVCWQYSDGTTKVGVMDSVGEVRFTEKMSNENLGVKVRGWWNDGLNNTQP